MTSPSLAEVQAPSLLRECRGWLVWRFEENAKGSKPNKVPYYTNGKRRHGVNGSPEDVSNLTDFESAKQFAKENNYTGVGLALLPEFGITALDFDNCIDDNGTIDSTVENAILGTYAEYSPSGKGIRAFVFGNLGDRKSQTKEDQFGFELFSTKLYVTFTGNTIELTDMTGANDTVSPPNEDLVLLVLSRFGTENTTVPSFLLGKNEVLGIEIKDLQKALNTLPNDLSYDDWLHTGMAIHHEMQGSEDGFIMWDSWSANSPKYSNEEYGRYKWDSFGRNTSSRPVTARSLIKRANAMGAGIFLPEVSISPDDFAPILEYKDTELTKSFFNIRTASEFMDQIKPLNWLIKGFLPKATLGVLYGESGSGKSFVALDICAALARQLDWNGLRCQAQARSVLYVVAEGVSGFAIRLAAYCHQAGISKDDIHIDIISDVAPNLTDGLSVDHLIRDIIVRQPYDLIVMDTFAQVTAGANENSGEDMGRALAYCRKISQSTDAMVLLIHHSGKDASKGARGWSGVHAASDVVLEVSRFEEERRIKVTKQKDGIDGAEYGFKLLPIYLGEDKDGDDITSCVVEYHAFVKPPPLLKNTQRIVYEVLCTFTEGSWATVSNVVELCIEHMPLEEGVKDGRKYNVRRTVTAGIGNFIEQNEKGEIRAKR